MTKPDGVSPPRPRRASLLHVVRTVAWGFFGVRRRAAHDEATAQITLPQVICAGILGAALLVATFLTVVRIVLS